MTDSQEEEIRQGNNLEVRERRGYQAQPDTPDDWDVWERVAAWPDEECDF